MPSFVREAASGRNPFVLKISIIAALGGLLFGYDTGVISGALLYIKKDLHTGTFAQSWIVGALLLGAAAGAVASGYLADRISRRWTKLVSGCVYVIGALGSAFAQETWQLIVARVLLGLAVGTASFVSPMYISEQTPPRIRGGTVSFNQLLVTVGILVAYVLNFLLKDLGDNWRWMLGLGAVPGLFLVAGMLIVPHTPRWLMSKGRREEARRVLERSRQPDEIDEEIEGIQSVLAEERRFRVRALFTGRVRPLLFAGLALAIFQQFVGVNTVIYFSPTILTYTGMHAGAAVTQAVSVGITNVVFTIVAVLLLDRIGRRKLLLTGTVGLTLSLGLLAAFFAVPSLKQDAPWLALVALIGYIACFAIGLGPVFWLMISEVFPLWLRSKAMAVCTVANWVANFLVSYFFLQLISWIGETGTFCVYGGLGVIAIAYFAWRIPETKNRSLEEIEHAISG